MVWLGVLERQSKSTMRIRKVRHTAAVNLLSSWLCLLPLEHLATKVGSKGSDKVIVAFKAVDEIQRPVSNVLRAVSKQNTNQGLYKVCTATSPSFVH